MGNFNLFGEDVKVTPCSICFLNKEQRVVGFGDVDSEVMVVGECPSSLDKSVGKLFTDESSQYLFSTLRVVGLSKEQCFFTTATLCRPRDGNLTRELAVCCRDNVMRLAKRIHPKVIILLGNAMFSLFPLMKKNESVSKHRGVFLTCPTLDTDIKVMITYSPDVIMRDKSRAGTFIEDIRKACRYVKGELSLVVENNYEHITDVPVFKQKIKEVKEAGLFGFDIETTNKRNKFDCYTENILSMSFSISEKTGFGILTDKHPETNWSTEEWWEVLGELRYLLGDRNMKAVVHNESFETSFLSKQMGIEFSAYADTLLMHFLLDETTPHGLKFLVTGTFPELANYDKGIDKSHMEKVPIKDLIHYNICDSDVTLRLYHRYLKQLQDNNFMDLFNHTMAYRRVLTQMEMGGVSVDTDKIAEVRSILIKEIDDIKKKIYVSAGKEFNINSPVQVENVLTEAGLKLTVKTEKGANSTGEDVLKSLKSKHPVVGLILKYRGCIKLLDTYLNGEKGIDANINPITHKIHTNFLVHGTKTGRISSTDPNLQNIPKPSKSEYGKMIRNIFVPRSPDWVWVEGDYKQIEYRILINYVKDETLINHIREGRDPHGETAARLFNIPQQQVTEAQRGVAKGVVFGLIYGRGYKSIAAELGISEAEGKRIVNKFFEIYGCIRFWIESQKEHIRKYGEISSFFGRKRRLPAIRSNDNNLRAMAEREGVNFVIQGTANDICAQALIRLWYRLNSEKFQAVPVLTIHDSIIVESPKTELEVIMKIMNEEMTRPIPGIIVPLAVDFKVVNRWGD